MYKPNIITSWDDGSIYDLKIAILLKKYNLQGTFFIPSNCELSDAQIKELSRDFELGGHTVTHPTDLKKLSGELLSNELEFNKELLEDISNKEVDYFCYPRGRYNEDTIEALKKAGFKRARTTLVGYIDKQEDLFRIKTSIHVYPDRKEYHRISWVEVANELWEKALNTENSQFHIWGHSWEIEKLGLWKELDLLFKKITK